MRKNLHHNIFFQYNLCKYKNNVYNNIAEIKAKNSNEGV